MSAITVSIAYQRRRGHVVDGHASTND